MQYKKTMCLMVVFGITTSLRGADLKHRRAADEDIKCVVSQGLAYNQRVIRICSKDGDSLKSMHLLTMLTQDNVDVLVTKYKSAYRWSDVSGIAGIFSCIGGCLWAPCCLIYYCCTYPWHNAGQTISAFEKMQLARVSDFSKDFGEIINLPSNVVMVKCEDGTNQLKCERNKLAEKVMAKSALPGALYYIDSDEIMCVFNGRKRVNRAPAGEEMV